MTVYVLRVTDPDNGWEKSVTLLLIVAVTAAFQLLGHCCCAGKRQSGLPAGAACGHIPLSEVVSSGSMQHQRWGMLWVEIDLVMHSCCSKCSTGTHCIGREQSHNNKSKLRNK